MDGSPLICASAALGNPRARAIKTDVKVRFMRPPLALTEYDLRFPISSKVSGGTKRKCVIMVAERLLGISAYKNSKLQS